MCVLCMWLRKLNNFFLEKKRKVSQLVLGWSVWCVWDCYSEVTWRQRWRRRWRVRDVIGRLSSGVSICDCHRHQASLTVSECADQRARLRLITCCHCRRKSAQLSSKATTFHGKPISKLRSVTCHMGTRNVICHPTQVNAPHLNNLSRQAGRPTQFAYLGGMEGWVDFGVGYILRQFTCLQTVTRPISMHLIATWLGVKPTTSCSQVQHPTFTQSKMTANRNFLVIRFQWYFSPTGWI